MKKSMFRLIVVLVILVLALAACSGGAATPPAGGDTTGGNAAGGTGGTTGGDTAATTAPTEASGGTGGTGETGGSGAAAACAGVDTQQLVSTGQTVYGEKCASCHGEQGAGQGNFPALAGNATVTGADVAGVVQKYLSVEAHPKDVTPDNLAAVLTYVRASFGNTAAPVCPTDVQIPAAP